MLRGVKNINENKQELLYNTTCWESLSEKKLLQNCGEKGG